MCATHLRNRLPLSSVDFCSRYLVHCAMYLHPRPIGINLIQGLHLVLWWDILKTRKHIRILNLDNNQIFISKDMHFHENTSFSFWHLTTQTQMYIQYSYPTILTMIYKLHLISLNLLYLIQIMIHHLLFSKTHFLPPPLLLLPNPHYLLLLILFPPNLSLLLLYHLNLLLFNPDTPQESLNTFFYGSLCLCCRYYYITLVLFSFI